MFDIGRHDGAPYIVSELLDSQTLRDRLGNGALPSRRAVAYGILTAHRKLSMRMRSASKRARIVATAQRPSRDAVM